MVVLKNAFTFKSYEQRTRNKECRDAKKPYNFPTFQPYNLTTLQPQKLATGYCSLVTEPYLCT